MTYTLPVETYRQSRFPLTGGVKLFFVYVILFWKTMNGGPPPLLWWSTRTSDIYKYRHGRLLRRRIVGANDLENWISRWPGICKYSLEAVTFFCTASHIKCRFFWQSCKTTENCQCNMHVAIKILLWKLLHLFIYAHICVKIYELLSNFQYLKMWIFIRASNK